jgi:hypothetical protein
MPNLKTPVSMRNPRIIYLAFFILSACTVSRPTDRLSIEVPQASEAITRSLFDSEGRTISEEDISKILNGHILLPESSRVALYHFGRASMSKYYSSYWQDEEFLKLRQTYLDTLVVGLRSSPAVARVSLIPSMLISSEPTITNLRESAVRMQSDVLIIFSIESDIYYKFKAFRKDRAKAFATIETLLLDVRTGIITYSSIITREKLIEKNDNDLDIKETQKRAESEAVILAMSESAKLLKNYFQEAH